jgi:hypothetical protein
VIACARRFRLALLVPIVAVFLVDWSLVAPYGGFNVTFYDELADAFLAGHLDLLRPPPEALMALPDPWDPVANQAIRLGEEVPGQRFDGVHDLALYQGRFYVQWGPFPALVLIPLRWIAGGDLPMGRLVLIVETVAALAYAASTLTLARLAGLPRSQFTDGLVVTVFLVCPVWQSVLRRVAVYETSVFFAQACLGLALLSVVCAFDRRLTKGSDNPALLAAGSVFLGLVVNCRPNLAPVGLMVPVLLWAWWRTGRAPARWQRMVGPAVALGGPAALLLAAALLYNRARFGSLFETGQSWQLWGGDESILLAKFRFLDPARILPNLRYYFLEPVAFNKASRYPLLIGQPLLPPGSWLPKDLAARYGGYIYRTSGLFVVAPLSALLLAAPFCCRRDWTGGDAHRLRTILLLLLPSGLLASLLLMSPAIMRYGAEWCLWWLAIGALVALRVRAGLQAGPHRRLALLFDAALMLTTAWSGWVGAAFLLAG